jgi:DNA primase
LRDVLLRCVAAGIVERDQISEALANAGLDDLRERLGAMAAHSTLWSVKSEAAAADAAESLRQALVLHRRATPLHKELRRLEARLAENPSEQDSERLRDIQLELSALDGTEAAIEGFGSMS